MQIDKKTLRNIFFGAAGCIILYWILHETERVSSVLNFILDIISPFVLGAAIAFVLNVPMRAIEKGLKGIKQVAFRRAIALTLTVIGFLMILTLVFWLLIPQLISSLQSLIPKTYIFASNLTNWVKELLSQNPRLVEWLSEVTDNITINLAELAQKLISILSSSMSTIISGTFTAIGDIINALFNAVIAFVFAIYCLIQKDTLSRQGRKILYAFFSEKFADGTIRILRLTNTTFSSFLSGQCIEVCILGCLFAIAMAIFRMPYIPLVCVLIAITAFVPVVGAWIGCALGAFFIFIVNPMQAVWFVVMFLILQQVENNLIYPHVVGNSIGLSGMWVLVAVAFGGQLMGAAGMFLMIPVASVCYTLFREVTNNRLKIKSVPNDKLTPQPPETMSRPSRKKKVKVEKSNNDSDNDK